MNIFKNEKLKQKSVHVQQRAGTTVRICVCACTRARECVHVHESECTCVCEGTGSGRMEEERGRDASVGYQEGIEEKSKNYKSMKKKETYK